MKRVFIGVIVIIISILSLRNNSVFAGTPELLIVEIQTASKNSATEEIIKIANTSNKTIDLSGIRIEYFAANPKSLTLPSRTINLLGSISAKDTFQLSSKGYEVAESQQEFSSTLAGDGGHLRLSTGLISNPIVYDFVGWGTALYPGLDVCIAPKPGETLMRLKNVNGEYVYSGNNNLDFKVNNQPKVHTETQPINNDDYSKIQITEILPNPAVPYNDADDEFIEIYNSGSNEINLSGLILKTGIDLTYKFDLKNIVIQPYQFLALYSRQTKLVLSNSEGKAELHSLDNQIVSKTENYDNSQAGMSYSFDGNKWQWTTHQTPNQENVFINDIAQDQKSTKNISKKLKSTSKKKPSKTKQVKSATTKFPKESDPPSTRPVKTTIIAGVGTLSLIYGIYEYREDFANFISKIRKRG